MVPRRRFVFRGNAAAIGGRIVRPADTIIESPTASSLTVAGGRSRAQAGATRFGQFVSIGAAGTTAEGLFDDVRQQVELSFGRVEEAALTMTTRVAAEVTTLSVGDKPKLTVKRVRAAMAGRSPAGSGEPPIDVGSDSVIEGAAIDQFGLVITFAPTVFQTLDTLSKVSAAADDPQFVRESGSHFFLTPPPAAGAPPTPQTRLVRSRGTVYATIVKSIRWAANPFPGATINQHVVTVPEFGKIFFGELLITGLSRRLTMIRLELGSPIGGYAACCDVETNGVWST